MKRANRAFRVWMIFTAIWLGFATWDIYSDSRLRIADLTNIMKRFELNDRDLSYMVNFFRDEKDYPNWEICLVVGRARYSYCDHPDLMLGPFHPMNRNLNCFYSMREADSRSKPPGGAMSKGLEGAPIINPNIDLEAELQRKAKALQAFRELEAELQLHGGFSRDVDADQQIYSKAYLSDRKEETYALFRDEEIRAYVASNLRDSRSEVVKEALWEFSLFGFLPPLGLLGSWFLGIWILRWFRPRT
jgi:hypothetical protein